MKKLLAGAGCLLIGAACFGAGMRYSDYPKTNHVNPNDLILWAIPGVTNVAMEAQYMAPAIGAATTNQLNSVSNSIYTNLASTLNTTIVSNSVQQALQVFSRPTKLVFLGDDITSISYNYGLQLTQLYSFSNVVGVVNTAISGITLSVLTNNFGLWVTANRGPPGVDTIYFCLIGGNDFNSNNPATIYRTGFTNMNLATNWADTWETFASGVVTNGKLVALTITPNGNVQQRGRSDLQQMQDYVNMRIMRSSVPTWKVDTWGVAPDFTDARYTTDLFNPTALTCSNLARAVYRELQTPTNSQPQEWVVGQYEHRLKSGIAGFGAGGVTNTYSAGHLGVGTNAPDVALLTLAGAGHQEFIAFLPRDSGPQAAHWQIGTDTNGGAYTDRLFIGAGKGPTNTFDVCTNTFAYMIDWDSWDGVAANTFHTALVTNFTTNKPIVRIQANAAVFTGDFLQLSTYGATNGDMFHVDANGSVWGTDYHGDGLPLSNVVHKILAADVSISVSSNGAGTYTLQVTGTNVATVTNAIADVLLDASLISSGATAEKYITGPGIILLSTNRGTTNDLQISLDPATTNGAYVYALAQAALVSNQIVRVAAGSNVIITTSAPVATINAVRPQFDIEDIRFWGASNNAVIDTPLNNAIAWAASNHRTVRIPAENYWITNTIVVPSRVSIVGEAGAFISCTNPITVFKLADIAGLRDVLISDLIVFGWDIATNGFEVGTVGTWGWNVHFLRVHVWDCESSATFIYQQLCSVTDCWFNHQYSRSHQIGVEFVTCINNLVTGSRFGAFLTDCLIRDGSQMKFIGSYFYTDTDASCYSNQVSLLTIDNSGNNLFSGCDFEEIAGCSLRATNVLLRHSDPTGANITADNTFRDCHWLSNDTNCFHVQQGVVGEAWPVSKTHYDSCTFITGVATNVFAANSVNMSMIDCSQVAGYTGLGIGDPVVCGTDTGLTRFPNTVQIRSRDSSAALTVHGEDGLARITSDTNLVVAAAPADGILYFASGTAGSMQFGSPGLYPMQFTPQYGQVNIDSIGGNNSLILGSDDGLGRLYLTNNGSIKARDVLFLSADPTLGILMGASGNYWFYLNNATSRAGIGTNNPAYPLDVFGGAHASDFYADFFHGDGSQLSNTVNKILATDASILVTSNAVTGVYSIQATGTNSASVTNAIAVVQVDGATINSSAIAENYLTGDHIILLSTNRNNTNDLQISVSTNWDGAWFTNLWVDNFSVLTQTVDYFNATNLSVHGTNILDMLKFNTTNATFYGNFKVRPTYSTAPWFYVDNIDGPFLYDSSANYWTFGTNRYATQVPRWGDMVGLDYLLTNAVLTNVERNPNRTWTNTLYVISGGSLTTNADGSVGLTMLGGAGDPGGTNARQWGSIWLTNMSTNALFTNLVSIPWRSWTNCLYVISGATLTTNVDGTVGLTITAAGGDPGGTNARQWGSAWLTNFSTNALFTNLTANPVKDWTNRLYVISGGTLTTNSDGTVGLTMTGGASFGVSNNSVMVTNACTALNFAEGTNSHVTVTNTGLGGVSVAIHVPTMSNLTTLAVGSITSGSLLVTQGLSSVSGNFGSIVVTNEISSKGYPMLLYDNANVSVYAMGADTNNTATESTIAGLNALLTASPSAGSTAFGFEALARDPGNYNVSVGWLALSQDNPNWVTNYSSTAVGANALHGSVVSNSVAIGRDSLLNTKGLYSVALGHSSLKSVYGNYSVALGAWAGTGSSGGDSNVYIGPYSGPTTGFETNMLYIGTKAGNPLLSGNFGSNHIWIPGTVHIGTIDATNGSTGFTGLQVTQAIQSYVTANATNVNVAALTWATNRMTPMLTNNQTGTVTFTGPVLSTSSSASNSPAANELPSAQWVRNLFNSGMILYASSNVFTAATNTDEAHQVYYFTNTVPPTSSRYYPVVNLNDYIGSVAYNVPFLSLQGPVTVNAYLQMTNGNGSPSVSVHPEFYYSYDRTNWYGDWTAQNQALSTGTNLYQWVISFPTITSTNQTGFYVQRRFKVGAVGGSTHPDVVFHVGTNYLTGTNDASHISLSGSSSAQGNAYLGYNQTFTGTNTFTADTIVSNLTVNGIFTSTNFNTYSNTLYTLGSNVAVALANTAMNTATNYTRSYAQPVAVNTSYATNVAWNIDLQNDSTVAITNTLGGSTANLWLTNVVDRKWFVARILADGTARTVSITNASGLTLNVINTNGFSVTTLPQIPITASKLCTIAGRAWVIAGTTNVDLWANVQQ